MMTMTRSRASFSGSSQDAPPSDWDLLMQRRRSSLGLSALFGTDDRRASFSFAGNPEEMLSAIMGATSDQTTTKSQTSESQTKPVLDTQSLFSSSPTSPAHEQEVPNFDDRVDLDMADAVTYGASLVSGSNASLKASTNLMLSQPLAMIKMENAVEFPFAHDLMDAVQPLINWDDATAPTVDHSAAAAFVHDRKRNAEYELTAEVEAMAAVDQSDYSDGGSPTEFRMGDVPRHHSLSAKRPRRAPPTSVAVLEAMPKPPPRGRPNPEREEALRGLMPEHARLEKNRRSAKECRIRKKEYVTNLEAKVAEFESRERARTAELESVHALLASLQQEVDALRN